MTLNQGAKTVHKFKKDLKEILDVFLDPLKEFGNKDIESTIYKPITKAYNYIVQPRTVENILSCGKTILLGILICTTAGIYCLSLAMLWLFNPLILAIYIVSTLIAIVMYFINSKGGI